MILPVVFTMDDEQLYMLLKVFADSENKFLEPSALAGFPGPARLLATQQGRNFLKDHKLEGRIYNAVHILWAPEGAWFLKKR